MEDHRRCRAGNYQSEIKRTSRAGVWRCLAPLQEMKSGCCLPCGLIPVTTPPPPPRHAPPRADSWLRLVVLWLGGLVQAAQRRLMGDHWVWTLSAWAHRQNRCFPAVVIYYRNVQMSCSGLIQRSHVCFWWMQQTRVSPLTRLMSSVLLLMLWGLTETFSAGQDFLFLTSSADLPPPITCYLCSSIIKGGLEINKVSLLAWPGLAWPGLAQYRGWEEPDLLSLTAGAPDVFVFFSSHTKQKLSWSELPVIARTSNLH